MLPILLSFRAEPLSLILESLCAACQKTYSTWGILMIRLENGCGRKKEDMFHMMVLK